MAAINGPPCDNNDNECSINYNNINSNDDDDEDGDDINDENEIHIIMFFSVFFCMISNS